MYNYAEKSYAKNPNNFKNAKLTIHAADKSDLYEITLTYIKTLDNNGAWDFKIQHYESENINVVTFKYNGTITAATSISKLCFHCNYDVKSEWE